MITDDIRLLWLCIYTCDIRTGPVGAISYKNCPDNKVMISDDIRLLWVCIYTCDIKTEPVRAISYMYSIVLITRS